MREHIITQKYELERLKKEPYVKREAEEKLKQGLQTDLIKVISGPRRAGKSFLAARTLKGNFGYVNFDDEVLVKTEDFNEILKLTHEVYGDFKTLFLDEVQNVEGWELFVDRLRRLGYNVVLTGSNSKLLSSELATHLTGRYWEVKVLPFSFREFLSAEKVEPKVEISPQEGKMLSRLSEYLEKGGFPEIVVKGYDYRNYGKMLFDSIIMKDVVRRRNVKYSSALYELALYFVSNFAREFSYTRLKNTLDIGSVHTVKNYVDYLEESFIILKAERFSYKLRESLKSPKKVYVVDPALLSAGFISSPNLGRKMENAVAVELLRRGYELWYWRDGRREVDFVLKKGLKIVELIQVTKEITRDNYGREVRNLVAVGKELKAKKLSVITWDEEDVIEVDGREVRVIPLWKWLIEG
ncbi:MAG: ATP-binding protein [Thermosipho sp. (in: Bacteria)]|nr:ATP-binding protein [Thermosipho sp. (in: thermotogales)]